MTALDIDVGVDLSDDQEQLVEEARLLLAMVDGHHLAYWQSRYDDELTRVEMMREAGGAAIGALFAWCVRRVQSRPPAASDACCTGTATNAREQRWRSPCSSLHPSMGWTTATKVHDSLAAPVLRR
jgi:hypothetical protein